MLCFHLPPVFFFLFNGFRFFFVRRSVDLSLAIKALVTVLNWHGLTLIDFLLMSSLLSSDLTLKKRTQTIFMSIWSNVHFVCRDISMLLLSSQPFELFVFLPFYEPPFLCLNVLFNALLDNKKKLLSFFAYSTHGFSRYYLKIPINANTAIKLLWSLCWESHLQKTLNSAFGI